MKLSGVDAHAVLRALKEIEVNLDAIITAETLLELEGNSTVENTTMQSISEAEAVKSILQLQDTPENRA